MTHTPGEGAPIQPPLTPETPPHFQGQPEHHSLDGAEFTPDGQSERDASNDETDANRANLDTNDEILTPEERVEEWLQASAEHFTASQREWRAAQACQVKLKGTSDTDFDLLGFIARQMPRHERRKRDNRGFFSKGTGGLLNMIRNEAMHVSWHAMEDTKDIADEGERLLRIQQLVQESQVLQMLSGKGEDDGMDGASQRQISDYMMTLAMARSMDRLDYQRTEPFLEDTEVVLPLFARLKEIAGDPDQSEFPGLLESIAIHNRLGDANNHENNLFFKALKRAYSDPGIFADEFVKSFIIEGKNPAGNKLSQQVAAAAAIIRLSVKNDQEDPAWQTPLIENLVGNRDRWPLFLKNELAQYAGWRIKSEWAAFYKAMAPYCHEPRRSKLEMTESATKRMRDATAAKIEEAAAEAMAGNTPKAIPEESKNTRETEGQKPRIKHFSVLKNSGGSRSSAYRAESIEDGIDGLMTHDAIDKYINKIHKGNTLMAEKVREALEALVMNPYDRTHTRAMTDAHFQLDGDRRQFKMHRFSLQKMPGVPKTSPAYDTRIYYSVRNAGGNLELMLLGIDHKSNTVKDKGIPKL